MLPQEYKPEVVPPSLIFGPQHLLRLFVKLPEILGRMKIEEKRLTMLLKFINEFLEFLVVYEKDLFSELAYEKNAEIWAEIFQKFILSFRILRIILPVFFSVFLIPLPSKYLS